MNVPLCKSRLCGHPAQELGDCDSGETFQVIGEKAGIPGTNVDV